MKKRFMSAFLAVIMLFSMLSTTAFAASSEEEALGEINIFNGGVTMSYLSINGRIREQIYTYYNRVTPSGAVKEIPAYCVNPNDKGVPQTVGVGESIKYLADEKAADPKVTGIIANGYPNRGLSELGLENKYHAYYATKMALWCYLLSHWDINNLKVNPNLTGLELERAQKILAAAKDIYRRGTTWTENLSPNVRCTPDRDVAYEVTVNGRQYKQQVFIVMAVVYFVLGSIISIGYARFNLDLVDRGEPAFETLFGFFSYWKTAAVAKLLQSVYVLLWSLLLIIPGIIATYSYAMTEFILAEHPDLTASEAIAQSKEMMSGNRWRLFCLHFSFIGWDILSSLTLGIGNLWLRPYKQAANAAFYREISGTGYAAFDPSYS